MILYHGSNMAVEKPRLIPAKRLLDFGAAFYLTSDFEQARKWAMHTVKIRETGSAIVSAFEFDDSALSTLRILKFDSPDLEWLHFVAANRTGNAENNQYDLIIGPVANDQAIRTVNDYLKGYFSEDIAIRILQPQKLKDQYAFKTDAALACLQFREAIR